MDTDAPSFLRDENARLRAERDEVMMKWGEAAQKVSVLELQKDALEAEVAKWRAELNGSEQAHAVTLRLNDALKKEEQDTRNQYTALKHSATERIAELEQIVKALNIFLREFVAEDYRRAGLGIRSWQGRASDILIGKTEKRRDPVPYSLPCGCYLKLHEDPGGVGVEEARCTKHTFEEVKAIEKRNDEVEPRYCNRCGVEVPKGSGHVYGCGGKVS